MNPRPEPEPAPPDTVDATVESPAARAKEGSAPGTVDGRRASAAPVRRPPLRAWGLALAADTLQWLLLPVFVPGYASPANVVLDLAVGVLLVRWCGWHWAFLPSFVAELAPGVDLVPTWTAAVGLVAWTKSPEP